MTDIKTQSFPKIVNGPGVLFVDAVALINFDRIGKLDTLLAANLTIIITPEIYDEAVTKGLAAGNPTAFASAQRIDSWIQLHSPLGDVKIMASDPNRALFTGAGAGDASIVADAAFLGGNSIVLSDDNHIALMTLTGTDVPVLTGNYFLNSLLLGGAITPNDYFQQTGAGANAGFNPAVLPEDSAPIIANGVQYELSIGDVVRGTYEFRSIGSSSITIDGQTIYFAPYEKGGIRDGLLLKFSEGPDGVRIVDLIDATDIHEWNTQKVLMDTAGHPLAEAEVGDDGTVSHAAWNGASVTLGDIGSAFGSSLGRFLGGNTLVGQVAVGTLIGAIGKEVGNALQFDGTFTLDEVVTNGVANVPGGFVGELYTKLDKSLATPSDF